MKEYEVKFEFKHYDNLEEAVKRLMEIFETTEESDNGVKFHPVRISSIRVRLTSELNCLMKNIKELLP